MNKLVIYILQLCLIQLRKNGGDVRMVYDNPQGSLSFQGNIKYVTKIPLPRRDA